MATPREQAAATEDRIAADQRAPVRPRPFRFVINPPAEESAGR